MTFWQFMNNNADGLGLLFLIIIINVSVLFALYFSCKMKEIEAKSDIDYLRQL